MKNYQNQKQQNKFCKVDINQTLDYLENKILNFDEALTKINKCIEVKQELNHQEQEGQFKVNQKKRIKSLRIKILPFRLIQKMPKHIIEKIEFVKMKGC